MIAGTQMIFMLERGRIDNMEQRNLSLSMKQNTIEER